VTPAGDPGHPRAPCPPADDTGGRVRPASGEPARRGRRGRRPARRARPSRSHP